LASVGVAKVSVPGMPDEAVGAQGGRWAFASVSAVTGPGIAVLALRHGSSTLVHTVPLPSQLGYAFGMTLTHDGKLLLVAGYTATAVVSVAALEDGKPDPVLGVLSDSGAGQFEVAVSGDDRYAFVTDETTGGLSVFDLATALKDGFSAPGVAAGIVPLANGAVGIAVSQDSERVYVTNYGAAGPHGQLWLIDAARAEQGAGRSAVRAHVAAGCQPVRVALSPDGSTAWVTALQSNALLAFDTAELQSHPSRALRAVVPVGSEPGGLLLVDNGRVALVNNSNRGLVPGTGSSTPQTVAVINTAAALAHRTALVGAIPAGLFPRDISYDPATGQVLVANYSSGDIELFRPPGP
jgi:DNA-binding beta-propeller fold protein YncE